MNKPPARIALVHDWLITFGGGERVLIEMHRLFPTAPIYTLFSDPEGVPDELEDAMIVPSVLQKFPGAPRSYQSWLPFYPYAIEQFDLDGFDVVISLSHCAAKGVLTRAGQTHLCYCFTPMRYIWDHYHTYLKHLRLSGFRELVFRLTASFLRQWDYVSAQRVDHFIAISETVKERIERIYGRKALVIHPPVDASLFTPLPEKERANEYFLLVSRFVAYKGLELVIDAFNGLDEALLIVGDGPLRERLMLKARNPRIEFLGTVTDEELKVLYQNALALVFPALEDFGLVPVEAMACGTPVIGLGKGGCAESVIDGVTGVLFPEQTIAALDGALDRFRGIAFNREAIRERALAFDTSVFVRKMNQAVESCLK